MSDSKLGTSADQSLPLVAGDLKAEEMFLPRSLIRRSGGLEVDLSRLESTGDFLQFVDHLFHSQLRFSGLDYPLFLKLLFEPEALDLMVHADGSHPSLRLAQDIVPFPLERQGIYHLVKFSKDGTSAEYVFEPVSIDQIEIEAASGLPESGSSQPVLLHKTTSVRTRLDPDEFVAAMWLQGLRYGLDMKVIQEAIDKDVNERREIAREKKMLAGCDASIQEQSSVLHRDDAPRILSNDRIDLRRFANHFPQVEAGKKLLKKVPRVLGKPGFDVKGNVLDPEPAKDFELGGVSGPGTRVERTKEGDFIVASITGFVNIDAETSVISVMEKIVNRQGISLRTTGDLTLDGADFEEHGEVQERRHVKGHNMHFHADVFGEVVSDGGAVHLHETLAGGSVSNPRGSIVIDKLASRSRIDARNGSVDIGSAESCLIMGSKVRIQRAVNCDIVADVVEITRCEGCAVAGRRISIFETASRKDIETVVTILMPDEACWDKGLQELSEKMTELAKSMVAIRGSLDKISQQPEVAKFLALRRRIKSHEIILRADHESGWNSAQSKFAGITRQLDKLNAELVALHEQENDLKKRIDLIKTEKQQALDALLCTLKEIKGHTVVRTLRVSTVGDPFAAVGVKELHHLLRLHGTARDQLFAGYDGMFAWSGKKS